MIFADEPEFSHFIDPRNQRPLENNSNLLIGDERATAKRIVFTRSTAQKAILFHIKGGRNSPGSVYPISVKPQFKLPSAIKCHHSLARIFTSLPVNNQMIIKPQIRTE